MDSFWLSLGVAYVIVDGALLLIPNNFPAFFQMTLLIAGPWMVLMGISSIVQLTDAIDFERRVFEDDDRRMREDNRRNQSCRSCR